MGSGEHRAAGRRAEPSARLRLLGRLCLEVDGEEVALDSPRAQTLVASLALTGEAVSREHLAALLWPESTQAQARTNLRKLLHTVRTRLPEVARYVETTDGWARWRGEACAVDAHELEAVITSDAPGTEELRDAVGLYRGDLLEALDLPWLDRERDRLRTRHRESLHLLAERCADTGDLTTAVAYARRAIDAEPLREESYRYLMDLHARAGERALALAVYHDCSTTLERELDVPPSPRTRAAYAALLPARPAGPAQTIPARGRFVGRARERERLTRAWSAAEGGRTTVVLVAGEAGIGKTRLTEEFLHWCARQGGVVAHARCLGTEGQLAYGPVATWLRQPAFRARRAALHDGVRAELFRLVPELGAAEPVAAEPRPEREQRRLLQDALAAALVVADRTVVLVLDDLQHADAETCDVVRHLLASRPDARLLLVATLRAEDLAEDGPARRLVLDLRAGQQCAEMELDPLDSADTAALAVGMGADLDEEDARSLWERTGGNPLFAGEAVRAAEAGDRTPTRRVQAVIESRLDRLRPSTRAVLDVAAVAGPVFGADLLHAAGDAGEDVVVEALDELWRRRIVRERGDGSYAFAHEVIREVAVGRVAPARRRVIHRRLAHGLERLPGVGEDVSARIAMHHAAAGDAASALSHYRRAAETAQALHAHAPALVLLEHALEQLRHLPPSAARDREELRLRLAQLAPMSSARGYAAPDLLAVQRRAMELTASSGVEPGPELLRSSAMSALTRGDYCAAGEGGRALEEAGRRTGTNTLLVEGAFVVGVTAFWQADFQAARHHLDVVVQRYRAEDRYEHLVHYGNDPKVSALARLGNTWWFLGEPERARGASADALLWARAVAHPYSLGIAAFFGALLALDMDDPHLLREHVATLAGIDSAQLAMGREALHGLVTVLDGAPGPGLAAIGEAVRRSRGEEAPGLSACLHRVMLAGQLAAGETDGALRTAHRLLGMGHGAQVWEAEAHRVVADLGTAG